MNFVVQLNFDSSNLGVLIGVLFSKVRDGIKNVSYFKDLNVIIIFKVIDKLVSVVFFNIIVGGNNLIVSDIDFEGGSGFGMEFLDVSKGKMDFYVVIVVGLDYFKFFFDLKIFLGGVEGEVFFVLLVGMFDDKVGLESD